MMGSVSTLFKVFNVCELGVSLLCVLYIAVLCGVYINQPLLKVGSTKNNRYDPPFDSLLLHFLA